MKILENAKEKLGVFGEWISIVGPVLGMFLFVHHENVHLNERLDNHMVQINKRCDILHQEFIDLLKDGRKQ